MREKLAREFRGKNEANALAISGSRISMVLKKVGV